MLWGLLVEENHPPLAILSIQGDPQKVVRRGERIEDDVLIREITPHGVHVDNRGRRDFLEVPKNGRVSTNGARFEPRFPRDPSHPRLGS